MEKKETYNFSALKQDAPQEPEYDFSALGQKKIKLVQAIL